MGCKFQLHNDIFLMNAQDEVVWCFSIYDLS